MMAGNKKPRKPHRATAGGPLQKLIEQAAMANAKAQRKRQLDETDPQSPAPPEKRERMLATMRSAMETITRGKSPSEEEWRILSDLVNMIETMEVRGNVPTAETTAAMTKAMKGMVLAAERYRDGRPLRLDGDGIQGLRELLDIYEQTLETFSERESLEIIFETDDRVREAQAGKTITDRPVIML